MLWVACWPLVCFFFFFKQKTAYEMRISDWSSDVCSSDLRHFRSLFTTLFQGGSAHLALVDSDDPLEAGLEIMAQPPGKKLTMLTLLSGGEQALTAVALVFALFLTNPAPICVLDEVDAPLDDANVERFCDQIGRAHV